MLTKMMPSQRARRPRHDSKASRQDNETENQMHREDEVSLRFVLQSPRAWPSSNREQTKKIGAERRSRSRPADTSPRQEHGHQYDGHSDDIHAINRSRIRSGPTHRPPRLLAAHRHPEQLLRANQMIGVLGVLAQVDLHPADPPGEGAVPRIVVVADRGSGV
jgi:hypothetical protein